MPRRFYRSRKRKVILLLCFALLATGRMIQSVWNDAPEVLVSGSYQVARVVDGDTLVLTSGARLRLQGVDAPEMKRDDRPAEDWAPAATEFTRDFIAEAGGNIRIELGPERKDRYGRFLGFVWHDQRMLNEELVRAGLARATLNYHFSASKKRLLKKAETEARIASRGIWTAKP